MKFEHVTPSRSQLMLNAVRARSVCHRGAVTAVTAGVPWRLVRPMLRDEGRILRLGHDVLYTTHLPWPGDQQGMPSWPW